MNSPILFNDPMGDKLSASNISAGSLMGYITSCLAGGINSIDDMFDFGDFNALGWDFSGGSGASGSENGVSGVSFGFNVNPNGGARGLHDDIIAEAVRAYVKDENYLGAYNKIINSYSGFYNISSYMNSLTFEDRSSNLTEILYGRVDMHLSKGLFKDFAYRRDPSFHFGALVMSLYHEYLHVYTGIVGGGTKGDYQGLFSFPFLNYRKTSDEEREFYAYYMMHQNRDLPLDIQQRQIIDYRNGLYFYLKMPVDVQNNIAYLAWATIMLLEIHNFGIY